MIIFGAGKLPEIAKSLGQGVKEFREEAQAPVVPATAKTAATATETTLRSDAEGARLASAETVDETGETVLVDRRRRAMITWDVLAGRFSAWLWAPATAAGGGGNSPRGRPRRRRRPESA